MVAEVVGVDGAQVGQGLPEDIRRATAGHRLECGVGVDDEPVCIGDENGFHGLFHHGGKTGDLLFGVHAVGEVARHGKDGANDAVGVEFGHEMGIEAAHFLVEGQVILDAHSLAFLEDLCQRATPEVHQLMRKRRLVDGRTQVCFGRSAGDALDGAVGVDVAQVAIEAADHVGRVFGQRTEHDLARL